MRRVLPVLVGTVIVLAGLVAVLVVVTGRDSGELSSPTAEGPGAFEATSEGDPPTSGTHAQRNVTNEDEVDDDQLLTALELGDVVLVYPQERPPQPLVQLQRDLTGPFDAELAAAGQMVVLVRRPDVDGIQALAWQRRLEVSDPADPALREFAEAWLGQGRDASD